ncbi:MAG: hypothetical protein R3B49_09910 [Phycisphaerales bacterium]
MDPILMLISAVFTASLLGSLHCARHVRRVHALRRRGGPVADAPSAHACTSPTTADAS